MTTRKTRWAALVPMCALLALTACNTTGGMFGGGTSPDVAMQQADAAMQAGNVQGAAKMYQDIVSQHPNYMPAHVKLGKALLAMNMPQEALPHFMAAANANPNDLEAVQGAGRCHIQMGNGTAAVPFFEQALALQPSPGAYAALGVAYDLAGRFPEAQATYRNGLKIDPQHKSLRNNMGLSLLLSGNPDGAIAVLQSVVNDPTATPQHRSNLALAYGVLGKENAARRMLEKDLKPADVSRNLAIYEKIRGMNGQSLREAVLLGDAGARGTMPAATQ
jgi:Flp pilus assembly protein TadD